MAIWSAEIKELETLYHSLKGQFPELEKELGHLIKTEDENVIMLYSRRCLEVIITDLCECELKRGRGTEPLKGIIDKLNKEKKIPAHIASSMYGLNELSTYGTHPKDFDPQQVKPVLNNLDIIIKWYLKHKAIDIKAKEEEKIQFRGERLEEATKEAGIEEQEEPVRLVKHKLLSGVLITAILVIAAIFAYPKIIKRDSLEYFREKGKIAIAVMPFQNMTDDSTKNYLRTLIQDNLVTNLSYFPEELIVRQTESVNYLIQSEGITNDALFIPTVASSISKKLDADFFIYGRIGKVGPIRLYAQLIDSKTKEIIHSFQEEVSSWEELTYQVFDAFSEQVKDFLIISILKKNIYSGIQKFASTDSLNAYKAFLDGQMAYNKADYNTAIEHYLNAIKVDSNFITAAIMLTLSYSNLGQRQDSKYLCDQARYWCDKAYSKRYQISEHQKILVNYAHALIYESPSNRITYINQLLEFDNQLPRFIYNLGLTYSGLSQHEKAIPEFKKVLEIFKKWGVKPERIAYITQLGIAYHETGKYRKEKRLYKIAERDFPDNPSLMQRQAILSLTEGDTMAANRYIDKYIYILKDKSVSEADIVTNLARIYSGAHILDIAEDYYTQALNLEPDSLKRMNNLAWFLIDNDRDIVKGLEYVERALELSPDNHFYLDCKGWGLYKQGKYQEALEVLNKSWELRPLYRYDVYLHLEAAKKAVADQKNN